ncbi:MAG TPA: glycosyltransferase [Acidimicrobiia bacterium]|nr:glycosyltransferase [Acidimicrobiia bacterium]
MRVLHASQATTEGVGRYLRALVGDQTARGWDVSVASPPNAELEALCANHGARHHRWDARRGPSLDLWSETRSIGRIARDSVPDVVHLHSSKAGLAGRLALRGALPTVFSPHAWSFLVGGSVARRAARAWERRAARWTDVFLCVGESERTRGAHAGIRGTWRVVPNAVDLDALSPATSEERSQIRGAFDLDGPTVVCVGRLAEQKGQDVLVRAWSAVRRSIPDATLVLVGEGPLRSELEQSDEPGVRLVGDRRDVRDWLVAADVVALPARWEGLSFVALEALACGCSIVATDADGMREVVGDGPDAVGAIVPVGSVSELGAAIIERLEDSGLRSSEAARARARAARFDSAGWGDRVADVLTDAVRDHGSSTRAR